MKFFGLFVQSVTVRGVTQNRATTLTKRKHTVACQIEEKGEQSIPSENFSWKILVDLSLVEMYKEKIRYFGYFVCGVINYTVNFSFY